MTFDTIMNILVIGVLVIATIAATFKAHRDRQIHTTITKIDPSRLGPK